MEIRPTLHDFRTERNIILSATHYQGYGISYATEEKCRKCQEFNETVKHILSGCPELAEKPYLY